MSKPGKEGGSRGLAQKRSEIGHMGQTRNLLQNASKSKRGGDFLGAKRWPGGAMSRKGQNSSYKDV